MARDRQGLEELHLALPIQHAAAVELGDPRDGDGGLRGVEVDDLLGLVLEGQDDRVRGEDGEVRVQLV